MAKLAFLVLNFKNINDTIKCVDSIQKADFCDYQIVLLDNGSNDGSSEKMIELYDNDKRISVLASAENVGFSRANNMGYEFIKKNFNPDFVIVTNNDVIFPQEDLDVRLAALYEETEFHLLGPDIYVRANKEHQSPMMLNLPTKDQLKNELSMYKHYKDHPEKWARRRKIQTIKNRVCQSNMIIQAIYDKLKGKTPINYDKRYINCCLQGACIIVSRKFLEAEDKMFTPEPFLYCEEIMLYKKCMKKDYKIVYEPSVQIWHEDGATMKKLNSNTVERANFTLKYHVESREMLLQLFEEE